MCIGDHLKNGRMWKDNIKMHLRKMGCIDVDLIEWKFCNCSVSYCITVWKWWYDLQDFSVYHSYAATIRIDVGVAVRHHNEHSLHLSACCVWRLLFAGSQLYIVLVAVQASKWFAHNSICSQSCENIHSLYWDQSRNLIIGWLALQQQMPITGI
jgi:hypothetical protein